MLHVDESCCGLENDEVSDKKQVLRRMTTTELGGADRLYPRRTIDGLPDDVLLETFVFYLDKDDADRFDHGHHYDGERWYMCAADGDVSCLLHHVA